MQLGTSFNDILWWITYPRMWFTSFFFMLFFPLSESDKAPDYKDGSRSAISSEKSYISFNKFYRASDIMINNIFDTFSYTKNNYNGDRIPPWYDPLFIFHISPFPLLNRKSAKLMFNINPIVLTIIFGRLN